MARTRQPAGIAGAAGLVPLDPFPLPRYCAAMSDRLWDAADRPDGLEPVMDWAGLGRLCDGGDGGAVELWRGAVGADLAGREPALGLWRWRGGGLCAGGGRLCAGRAAVALGTAQCVWNAGAGRVMDCARFARPAAISGKPHGIHRRRIAEHRVGVGARRDGVVDDSAGPGGTDPVAGAGGRVIAVVEPGLTLAGVVLRRFGVCGRYRGAGQARLFPRPKLRAG